MREEQAAFDELAAQLVGQQVAIDEAEDAEHGPDGGGRKDDLPSHLRRKAERLARIKKAKAQLDERDAAARQQMLDRQKAKQAAYDARTAAAPSSPPSASSRTAVGYANSPPRGLDNVTTEFSLGCIHNILKLIGRRMAPATA